MKLLNFAAAIFLAGGCSAVMAAGEGHGYDKSTIVIADIPADAPRLTDYPAKVYTGKLER